MKAILEFNLPEDNNEHDIHVNSGNFFVAIDDYLARLRQIVKYKELLNSQEDAIIDDIPEIKDYNGYEDIMNNFLKVITIPSLTDEQRNVLLKLHENYHKHEQTEKLREELFTILNDRDISRFF